MLPETVKFEMAQAASFLVENSECCKCSMIGAIRFASITDWKVKVIYEQGPTTYLNLALVAGSDVGQEPDGFFVNFIFSMAQQGAEKVQCTTIEHDLGTVLVAKFSAG